MLRIHHALMEVLFLKSTIKNNWGRIAENPKARILTRKPLVFQSEGGIQDNAVPSKANANQAKAMQEKIFRAPKIEITENCSGNRRRIFPKSNSFCTEQHEWPM